MKKLCLLLTVLILLCAMATPVLAADAPVYIAGNTYYDAAEKVFLYYTGSNTTNAIRSNAADGMITAQEVTLQTDAGMAIAVYLNGERLDSISGGVLQTPGEYVVMDMSGSVSQRIFSFTIVPELCNYVTGYVLPAGFEFVEVTLNDEAISFENNYIQLTEEGEYNIQYRCSKTNESYQLQLQTDFTGPVLALEAVTDGLARGPVDISDAKDAAVVNIYHEGEKISRKDILTESGEYYIELADEAGNKATYSFTILIYFDGNSWLFFLMVLFACVGVIIYLMHSRKHLRVR